MFRESGFNTLITLTKNIELSFAPREIIFKQRIITVKETAYDLDRRTMILHLTQFVENVDLFVKELLDEDFEIEKGSNDVQKD